MTHVEPPEVDHYPARRQGLLLDVLMYWLAIDVAFAAEVD